MNPTAAATRSSGASPFDQLDREVAARLIGDGAERRALVGEAALQRAGAPVHLRRDGVAVGDGAFRPQVHDHEAAHVPGDDGAASRRTFASAATSSARTASVQWCGRRRVITVAGT